MVKQENAVCKKKILSAFLRLSLEKGYCNTSLSEIYKEAGITSDLYKTKSDLVKDFFEVASKEWSLLINRIVGEKQDRAITYATDSSLVIALSDTNENLREIFVQMHTRKNLSQIIAENAAKNTKTDFDDIGFSETVEKISAIFCDCLLQKSDSRLATEQKTTDFLKASFEILSIPKDKRKKALKYINKLNAYSLAENISQGLKVAATMGVDFGIEKLTSYSDGYNLYRMDIKYDYNFDNIIGYGIKDDKTSIDAIIKEVLPYFPVNITLPDFGCTAFTAKDTNGGIHMGRNYDFKHNTSAMLVYCTPKNGYKSVAFAALDNISANNPLQNITNKFTSLTAPFICLDGMNEKGVSIAVLTLDCEPTRQNSGKPAISTSLVIRLVLDYAATTEEAVQLLKKYDMIASNGRDYHFYITDASGDGRVIEYDCDSDTRQLTATPTEVTTNFFVIHKDKVLPNQKNGIYGHGKERFDAVNSLLDKNRANITNETVWAAIKEAAQEYNPLSITSNTQWSIAYNNTDLTAEIALRRHWDDIKKYDLKTNRTE